ncbi:Hsp20/alpha crystallin family protein [Tuwongella immobilis]|uniref:SHSP domain-containing protein n=1 Tax=Tuwongella immobilis TaxID=692036 RepID=A0A6C2YL24_9BACT|nr:Hsp20/alpha crystallin family protein [Tuwongella immobilis]VIP02278.1 Heat shock protein Hsp20 OS=Rhodopirellula maiorica SM1 GN=RMSM_05793 PE=3 SV=1: HSP20 [Tuwongella immobilis]VTS00920.1 Heat shock protein Hsp20 OS=Rhodopirellula maiorica SM1 GN=RMSM_05793 PE=3 SV=1: HSP20 [Tuwongella immobilis]
MSENSLTKAENSLAPVENHPGATISPRVDILERETELLLIANLPGVKSDDVEVRFENGELTLHGVRSSSHAGKNRLSWEYEVAHYHRSFRLSENIAADQIHADFSNGVLTVHLPKVEAVKPRKITVRSN